jgi:hypothetical protein
MSDKFKPRSGQDRRKRDIGPPEGWKERRRNPERRLPEVEEISIAEFMRLMAEAGQPAASDEEDPAFDWDEVRKL